MKIEGILNEVDLGHMALPEFQRGYVWNREQVRGLMQSLYKRHPVGSLMVWVTRKGSAKARGGDATHTETIELLLDGQQRITSLYGIVRGKPPAFFDGNAQTFTGLQFHLEDEIFEFVRPLAMKDNPLWVDVTELMKSGPGTAIGRLFSSSLPREKIEQYIKRVTDVAGIKDTDLHIERVSGEDKTIDVVVDIFNRVNSGGTKLSKGDLALARICAEWPEAREEMRTALARWEGAGFYFDLDWLLRNMNTIVTGEAAFAALKDVATDDLRTGLRQAEDACNYLLNAIGARLGLDHDRVLGGRYAFPVMTRLIVQQGGGLRNTAERDKLLYWYVHSFLWGRYAGSTETVLNQDLDAIDGTDDPFGRLIERLRVWRGHLRVRPEDFGSSSLNARSYPLLYLLTRVGNARDWENGLPLSANMLGRSSALHVHHIFPKALLYQHGYERSDVNAIANFCFLSQEANLAISDAEPVVYLRDIEKRHPGALASQWVPMQPDLWRIERYLEFLTARRELLARAANEFLDSLLTGSMPEKLIGAVPGGIASEEEENVLRDCNEWITSQGLPPGKFMHELDDPVTGEPLAVLDLAWPNGLQEGLSDPVVLLIDESQEAEQAVNRAGYRFFTDVETFKSYVRRDVLAVEPVSA